MNTCDNCKYWDKTEDTSDLPSSKHGHRLCLHVKLYEDYSHSSPDSVLSYESIGTGPKFGCIHFEKG